uniref:NHR domain-containing protein n=1 Tax=Alexandrium monilatum TaxID=311494 RepID=A0A7S4UDS3_9DINO|mmetsp:Transcript_94453/g.281941  ORF Transcript_94453/g.281941 Transcript_94453/m.281941 type:complete len:472 (+) Transcript_94453:103-1518(+)
MMQHGLQPLNPYQADGATPFGSTGLPLAPAKPMTVRYGALSSSRVISAHTAEGLLRVPAPADQASLSRSTSVSGLTSVSCSPTLRGSHRAEVLVEVCTSGPSVEVPVEVMPAQRAPLAQLDGSRKTLSVARVPSTTASTITCSRRSPSSYAPSVAEDDVATSIYGDSSDRASDSLSQYMQNCWPGINPDEANRAEEAVDIALKALARAGFIGSAGGGNLDFQMTTAGDSPTGSCDVAPGDHGLDKADNTRAFNYESADRSFSNNSALSVVMMPVVQDPVVGPFSQDTVGSNLIVTDDGCRAARRCGCRESTAIGSMPLQRQAEGLYFEVRVLQTVEGWMGGLGIGITHTKATDLQRIPDKAWRVPSTFIVGYSGCAYVNGKENGCAWQPDNLKPGQRVGCLITGNWRQDMVIYVDGKEVFRIEGSKLREGGLRGEPLYPIVDVCNATLAAELLPRATAPKAARAGAGDALL